MKWGCTRPDPGGRGHERDCTRYDPRGCSCERRSSWLRSARIAAVGVIGRAAILKDGIARLTARGYQPGGCGVERRRSGHDPGGASRERGCSRFDPGGCGVASRCSRLRSSGMRRRASALAARSWRTRLTRAVARGSILEDVSVSTAVCGSILGDLPASAVAPDHGPKGCERDCRRSRFDPEGWRVEHLGSRFGPGG
jgi:hypothetical protein